MSAIQESLSGRGQTDDTQTIGDGSSAIQMQFYRMEKTQTEGTSGRGGNGEDVTHATHSALMAK
ncbi:hypothetical protein [Pseudomonas mangiferae]|uniref:Uncharacterized protein n=1 Tax=Pseudomonas mangiferae TaxID=2593654 RepID=A0A553GZR6_9PSED|nr:hypothetical protein [Pseudomonas mangiferae]TRX74980.1 hypothetical protein FM069_10680 [Pseudomonas mangiferae]